ncbi:MAG: family 20 glycosylhydrolase [Lachnospiraceae bacterium]|nr:family 20 glycosylhydrolase [Lachnospiraceae bacterium]
MVIKMGNRKKGIISGGITAVALVCVIFVSVLIMRDQPTNSKNLALMKGVTATCDSTEKEELSADMAIDGDDETLSSRWSSENNWEDASHYIELEFPEEISVSFVVLKWERRNAVSYALEGSLNGSDWTVLKSYDTAPEAKNQEIVLDEAVRVRYLRLSVEEVSKREEDYSNLYQNVSLYEFEVYADKPAAYQVQAPVIEMQTDGSRHLSMPQAPEGYTIELIGADLEQVIGADGTVYDTIQDKKVTVGYRVQDIAGQEKAQEVSFCLEVPAYQVQNQTTVTEKEETKKEETKNACPEVVPALQEWKGGTGTFTVTEQTRLIVDVASADKKNREEAAQALRAVAELLAEQYYDKRYGSGEDASEERPQQWMEITEGTMEDTEPGDIYLGYAKESNGLGEEGYTCDITDRCVIKAESATGIRWGTVTLLQMLFPVQQAETGSMSQVESDAVSLRQSSAVPRGQIRDYPLYEVRGFGIDVARKAVSADMLYRIMETMSWYKMNDLTIHLNDNAILSTSGLTDSVESAMTAYSAFRLESDITNGDGERLTSEDYSYTKEEFAGLIAAAKTYGVTVVPEIDTPAHSLSITKLFPEYALTSHVEAVDQINLHNADAKALVKEIWAEALESNEGAFRDAEIVGIGMDEYYGDGEEYRRFLVEIKELVQSAGKTVRLWGSLGNVSGTTVPEADNMQMNIWSMIWADPREMYDAGYSIINMQNNHLYIIPGGGYDYLELEDLQDNWEPNKFYDYNELEVIPAYSPQMLGAAYMIWNDMSRELDISEEEMYERFVQPINVIADKLWQ